MDTVDPTPVMSATGLQSRHHRDLLDVIDKMRHQGINRQVDLPEIIVCGEQSSGKSSVLEAISGLSFPTKDNLCTRFATELILRRSPMTSVDVSIIPDVHRPKDEKLKLNQFEPYIGATLPDLRHVVEAAKVAMGLTNGKVFSRDILRVELSGPLQPHLTMVDLPGLFQAGNSSQSEKNAEMIKELVLGYMKRQRSIILAVVSAENDFANQEVTKYTRQFDPDGLRTLGPITKPDTLDVGSDSERAYVELAKNQDVKFRLGWHVLKNRGPWLRDATFEQRDEDERKFFAKSIWESLDPRQVGVASLKPRLSDVLESQILAQLPNLLEDVKKGVADCKARLGKLGTPRNTPDEQRSYLINVSLEFSRLMKAAVDGAYDDPFFGSLKTLSGQRRRLRAVIQNRLTDFDTVMKSDGHAMEIVDGRIYGWRGSTNATLAKTNTVATRSQFIAEVKIMMEHSRGRELPGTFNPLIIGELFAEQCKPWKVLAPPVVQGLLSHLDLLIMDILKHVTVEDVANAIMSFIIKPEMQKLNDAVFAKVNELLAPHSTSHPITYNRNLTEMVQKAQKVKDKDALETKVKTALGTSSMILTAGYSKQTWNLNGLVHSLMEDTESDMADFAARNAINYMQAYYQIELKRFVDDISVLAVEQCLISKLPDLFSPAKVRSLSFEDVESIAAEAAWAVTERKQATLKLSVLESGLRDLMKLDRHRTQHIAKMYWVC